jgi:hypothetical protein
MVCVNNQCPHKSIADHPGFTKKSVFMMTIYRISAQGDSTI